jgi:uncharacterized protein Yka (UPF0111/DUF47 family)
MEKISNVIESKEFKEIKDRLNFLIHTLEMIAILLEKNKIKNQSEKYDFISSVFSIESEADKILNNPYLNQKEVADLIPLSKEAYENAHGLRDNIQESRYDDFK